MDWLLTRVILDSDEQHALLCQDLRT